MDRIDHLADYCVRKGCAFAALAIAMVMSGLSFDLLMAFHAGAILTVLMGVILALRAWRAPKRGCRGTELWALLKNGKDLPAGYPQSILTQSMRMAYIRYAELTGAVALLFCLCTFVLMLLRR